MKDRYQSGNILFYILIAIALTGLLIASMTKGADKNASSGKVDEMMFFLQGDLKVIQAAVNECVQTYRDPVDVNGNGTVDATDNPNAPFPLYNTLLSGGAGDAVADIKCPGAPAAQQAVFSGERGYKLKLLADTATYTTTYFTDGVEGVYLRIARAASDAFWAEALSRLNANKFSACSAAVVTDGGACANSCLYYWITRRSTSVLGGEVGCP